jgi:signal transduction histidine kinase
MLYLKLSAADACAEESRRVPLAEPTAILLERALLSRDFEQRRADIREALDNDAAFAGWALRACEARLGCTINRTDEAAEWLSRCLESELAGALVEEGSNEPGSPPWRFAAVVARLNECQQKLSDFDRRLEHEKLASLKELAYGASHEINNPLANIAARAQTLLELETDTERARKLTAIHRQAMRAHEMISDLMLFARPPKLDVRPLDLRPLVERIVDERRAYFAELAADIACETAEAPVMTRGDETQLSVAVDALVQNAIEAAGDGGRVRVTVRRSDAGGLPLAEVCVRDNGPGISDEVRRHMFDPFFSGREAGRGLGFGLPKCWRIVTEHEGQVVVHRPTSGAEISIILRLEPTSES